MYRNVQRSPPQSFHSPRTASDSDLMQIVSPVIDDCGSVTQRDKRRRLSGEEHDDLTAFRMEMRKLFEKFTDTVNTRIDVIERHIFDVKSDVGSISSTNKEIGISVTFVSEQIHALESKIENLERDRKSLSIQMSSLEEKCEELLRNSLKTSIEIRNVPKTTRETRSDLFGMVTKLSTTLKIKLEKGDVRDVYRIPYKNNRDIGKLIVEFSDTHTKGLFLTTAKKFNRDNHQSQMNSSSLGLGEPNLLIYVSEHLTPKAHRLFSLARDVARSENFEYCWTANGRVFLRKKQGQPYVIVQNEAQLNSLKTAK